MIAADTNVLARYLLNDDFEQAKAAARLLAGRELIDIPLSVWLELVWVLQVNDCSKPEIVKGLRHIIGLPSIRPRAIEVLLYALRWYEDGMDFSDALHLAMSAGNERFATFDKALTKLASRIGGSLPVSQPGSFPIGPWPDAARITLVWRPAAEPP